MVPNLQVLNNEYSFRFLIQLFLLDILYNICMIIIFFQIIIVIFKTIVYIKHGQINVSVEKVALDNKCLVIYIKQIIVLYVKL